MQITSPCGTLRGGVARSVSPPASRRVIRRSPRAIARCGGEDCEADIAKALPMYKCPKCGRKQLTIRGNVHECENPDCAYLMAWKKKETNAQSYSRKRLKPPNAQPKSHDPTPKLRFVLAIWDERSKRPKG